MLPVPSEHEHALVAAIRASFERLQAMVAGLHPTEEADPAKAEMIAALKRELESPGGGIEELQGPLPGEYTAGSDSEAIAVLGGSRPGPR